MSASVTESMVKHATLAWLEARGCTGKPGPAITGGREELAVGRRRRASPASHPCASQITE